MQSNLELCNVKKNNIPNIFQLNIFEAFQIFSYTVCNLNFDYIKKT
jgi:hypothetical protein